MSSVKLYKYSGAGNDFVLIDGRSLDAATLAHYRSSETISNLCDRHSGFLAADGRIGADGLMILGQKEGLDFVMEYYNSDGSGGMMCGNGGRCITAFAFDMGIRPAGDHFRFEAADGLHSAEILRGKGTRKIVRIGMIDAFGLRKLLGGYFLNTGTRHFVLFCPDVEAVEIDKQGPELRWNAEFAPEGANVNFVTALSDGTLKVRTFEKGVEAETLACGTGLTASAIAAHIAGIPATKKDGQRVSYQLHARQDDLSVDFIPADPATEVFLTGPAEQII
ncbi:MAG: diaminopimelate epimerase [Bacteroidales bacterium]|nr:diaminopimelate epimerase [Bacteroidales bacterium]